MNGSGVAGGPEPDSQPADRRRLWWWLTIAGAVVVLAVIVTLVALAVAGQPAQPGQGPSDGQSASDGESPDPEETGGSDPGDGDPADPDATIDPDFGEPVADTAVGDEQADFGDSVTARVTAVDFITVTGTRAGEVSGPAVRVAVELANGTDEPISLDAVTVNAYYGSETQPASPFDSETEGDPFAGSLAGGGTATGTYVFSIPEGQDEDIVVTVSKGPDSPLVVFRR